MERESFKFKMSTNEGIGRELMFEEELDREKSTKTRRTEQSRELGRGLSLKCVGFLILERILNLPNL
jgi:hypothetical protein